MEESIQPSLTLNIFGQADNFPFYEDLPARLLQGIDRAIYGLRPRSRVKLAAPQDSEVFTYSTNSSRRSIRFKVETTAFEQLKDGYWCIYSNDEQAFCVGDATNELECDPAKLSGSSNGEIEVFAGLKSPDLSEPKLERISETIRIRTLL